MTAPGGPGREALLLGTISRDRYLATGEVLPGGGVLNMAWHWRRLGRSFRLLTRVGAEDGDRILEFLARNAIEVAEPADLVASGRSSSIDIEIQPDRQPWMDNFIPGVWDDYRLTTREREAVAGAERLHAVLVEGAITELERLAADGVLDRPTVSADFLGFRHYTVERLARTLAHVELGFIGWPGAEDAPEVQGMRRVANDLGRVLVVTLGATAVLVFDGRDATDHRHRVRAVEVAGTTLGCGDAFIAWFLDELWRTGDHDAAVARGMMGGASATAWLRPLPDEAYGLLVDPQTAASPA